MVVLFGWVGWFALVGGSLVCIVLGVFLFEVCVVVSFVGVFKTPPFSPFVFLSALEGNTWRTRC